jgi:phosphohistidine phosphatase
MRLVDVFLVRHAIAEPRDPARWPDDSQRPLSPEGADLFRLAARGLRRIGVEVEVVLASSYVRAWRTAEILTEEAGWPEPTEARELEAASSPSAALELAASRTESLLALVGHEPDLSELASLALTGDAHGASIQFKKGGVACLRFGGVAAAARAELRWSASPKILRQLGR